MSHDQPLDGAQAVADHLTNCREQDAAIVIDGNGDDTIAALLAAGWTWQDGGPDDVDYVAGKRVQARVRLRLPRPPGRPL